MDCQYGWSRGMSPTMAALRSSDERDGGVGGADRNRHTVNPAEQRHTQKWTIMRY